MTQMTQAEYARTRGVSRAAITKWKKESRIEMVGDMVDVEASDAKLQRTRRYGLSIGNRGQGAENVAGIVLMTPQKATQRITALDWTVDHDFSEAALDARARQAAECVGWVAVTSEVRDDGHHGGYQVRYEGKEGRAAIVDGFGFELTALEVVSMCRKELEPDGEDDDNFQMTVRPELFAALALPIWPGQSKQSV